MEAVKRGGDRQQLHEVIRESSMAATDRMKNGESCDLLERLAAVPAFGMTADEMREVLDPKKYTGHCAEQTEALLQKIRPMLEEAPADEVSIEV